MKDILVVEDGLHERERLESLFTEAGFSVACAEGVAEAETLLTTEQYRLAILDVGLGDKSGSFLFRKLKQFDAVPFVIILTGNPSVHLKQRFLDEGAAAYIVKATAAASNDSLLGTVRGLLGGAEVKTMSGLPLAEFLRRCVDESSRALFLAQDEKLPVCRDCGGSSYMVTFSHKTQLPPVVEGRVVCESCRSELDPEVG